MSSGPLPLEGIRVLDLTHALAGPYCTMLLADLGADVVKVESPEGDHARRWGPPFVDGESAYFLSVNRNKRSIALDLKSEAGLAAAIDLALASDVLVENFRPGTAARLGLGWDVLHERHPALVYASISGFGQGRPTLAGYDQIAQGTSGLMSITGERGQQPTKVGVPVGDITAGMFAAHAIMASLVERARTGVGRYIDVALNDALLALLTYQAGRYFATGEPPAREGNHHSTIAPYGTFATRDGHVNIAVGSDEQYRRFCEALQAPELAQDPRFTSNADRQAARPELTVEIERRLTRRTTGEWLARMEAAGIPAGPINDLAVAFSDPTAVEREMRVEVDHPVAGRIGQVGAPWKLDGMSSPMRMAPPLLGEHTDEVLTAVLGYGPEQVAAVRERPPAPAEERGDEADDLAEAEAADVAEAGAGAQAEEGWSDEVQWRVDEEAAADHGEPEPEPEHAEHEPDHGGAEHGHEGRPEAEAHAEHEPDGAHPDGPGHGVHVPADHEREAGSTEPWAG